MGGRGRNETIFPKAVQATSYPDSVAEISRMEAEEKAVEKRAKNKVHDENAPA